MIRGSIVSFIAKLLIVTFVLKVVESFVKSSDCIRLQRIELSARIHVDSYRRVVGDHNTGMIKEHTAIYHAALVLGTTSAEINDWSIRQTYNR